MPIGTIQSVAPPCCLQNAGGRARALTSSLRCRRRKRRQWCYRATGTLSLVAPNNLARFVSLIAADVARYSAAESPEYNNDGQPVIPRQKNGDGQSIDAQPTRRPRRAAPTSAARAVALVRVPSLPDAIPGTIPASHLGSDRSRASKRFRSWPECALERLGPIRAASG